MTQSKIEALLRQKIGLDALSIGSNTIARAISQRMANCRLTDPASYLEKLQAAPEELEALIESVVIPETWFFRDREPFVFLRQYLLSEWWSKNPGKILRVLSLPCATGEEPYSIAIALMEAGLSSKSFKIDAVDISKIALNKARRAVYGKNSFRGKKLDFLESYFTQIGNEYHLRDSVKNTVNFIYGNVCDRSFLANETAYDIIFCRNLLIYFDDAGRQQTIQLLDRLLTKQGLLFLGHSETGQALPLQFSPVRHPLAFAYRKEQSQINQHNFCEINPVSKSTRNGDDSRNYRFPVSENYKSESKTKTDRSFHLNARSTVPKTPDRSPISQNYLRSQPPSPSCDEVPQLRQIPSIQSPVTTGPLDAPSKISDCETARSLADRGQLQEAARLCETYLSQNPVSVEAHVLLGQIYQAVGNQERSQLCFQKAIYLEPDSYEALIHLALLKENRGDIAGANLIRQRIQRLQK
jgi:chemotaxis protein methyltransferase WspC